MTIGEAPLLPTIGRTEIVLSADATASMNESKMIYK